jgi:CRP-like cAMP-binding protein
MRNIAWLRTIAVASGLTKIVAQQFYSFDPIDVFWESLLITINLGQLALIWWDNRQRVFSPAARQFLSTFDPKLPNAAAAALLSVGYWHEAPAGSFLTVQGKPVDGLIYLSAGHVRIESGGRAVASCSVGDFLGEMTWQSGKPATGTAVAEDEVRYLRFERHRLEKLLAERPVLQYALQTSFNRNLIAKLERTNTTAPATAQPA